VYQRISLSGQYQCQFINNNVYTELNIHQEHNVKTKCLSMFFTPELNIHLEVYQEHTPYQFVYGFLQLHFSIQKKTTLGILALLYLATIFRIGQ
jgi:hypothetical protein